MMDMDDLGSGTQKAVEFISDFAMRQKTPILQGTAKYEQDKSLGNQIEKHLKLTGNQMELKEFLRNKALTTCRVAAADFLLARLERQNISSVVEIVEDGVGEKLAIEPLKKFVQKLEVFYQACVVLREEWPEMELQAAKLEVMKTGDIVQAVSTCAQRICGLLEECFVPWHSFFVLAVNVARIKQELVGNPNHNKIEAACDAINDAQIFLKSLFSAMGKKFPEECPVLSQRMTKCVTDGMAQIGAAAIGTAIYVTIPNQQMDLKTKKDQVKLVKGLINSMNIQVPVVLISYMDDAIKEAEAQVDAGGKKSAKGKAKAKPKTGNPPGPNPLK